MKKISHLIIVLSLISCKTIKVNEKSAFQESRYKFEEFSNYINQSTKSQKEKNKKETTYKVVSLPVCKIDPIKL